MRSLIMNEDMVDCDALEKAFEMRAERLVRSSNPMLEKEAITEKIVYEVVRDFNGTYYTNISVGGNRISGLPEYVDYKSLKKAVKEKCQVELPHLKDLDFQRSGRKQYACFSREKGL